MRACVCVGVCVCVCVCVCVTMLRAVSRSDGGILDAIKDATDVLAPCIVCGHVGERPRGRRPQPNLVDGLVESNRNHGTVLRRHICRHEIGFRHPPDVAELARSAYRGEDLESQVTKVDLVVLGGAEENARNEVIDVRRLARQDLHRENEGG